MNFENLILQVREHCYTSWATRRKKKVTGFTQRTVWKQLWRRNPYRNTKIMDPFEHIQRAICTVYLTPSVVQLF